MARKYSGAVKYVQLWTALPNVYTQCVHFSAESEYVHDSAKCDYVECTRVWCGTTGAECDGAAEI